MEIFEAITPIDGRNYQKLTSLVPYFPESALNKYRVIVELKYLEQLARCGVVPSLTRKELDTIRYLIESFGRKDHQEIKKIEDKINHDVKAVEYYLRDRFKHNGLSRLIPYIHIGLTSEDVNNLAYSLILKEFKENVLEKSLDGLLRQIKEIAVKNKDVPLLGRTHGQPAIPTTVGKEMANYYHRLKKHQPRINSYRFEGKCNGAVGSFNAMQFVYPQIDWIKFSQDFVSSLGLAPNLYVTQILFYDNWLEFFQMINLINGILLDFSINIWQYIMLEVFVQKKAIDEVGSSTMPQKINPITFEHAEGSLQLANSYFDLFQRKLIVSRLQRDLSDSTVRRTFGNAFAYTILGWQSISRGLQKISVNKEHVREELDNHWEVLAEAVQIYLRSKKDDKAYEKLKALTQGKKITREVYSEIIKALGLDKEKKFAGLTPEKYVGLAKELVSKL